VRSWRRFRRRFRRLSTGKKLGLIAVSGVILAGLSHQAQVAVTPSSVSGNVALGQQLAGAYGWGSGAQWSCLDDLWQKESSWSNTAVNPQSGAYGIPQSLPPWKMPTSALPPQSSASAQIIWGLGYIESTYGSACQAWSHEEADGWY
jgi:resuscitation-promoting factor RpfB